MKNSLRKRKASDMIGPHWSEEDLTHFYQAYRKYGKDWEKVAAAVKPRTAEMVEALYIMHMAYLSLPEGTASAVGLIALISDHYCYLLWPRCRTRFRNSSNGSRAWCRRNHTPSVLGWSYQRVDGRPAVIASVLHHEAFLRIRKEHEDEVRDLTEKSDTYKLLSEKRRADLVTARDEHAEMAEQVQQRLEQIGRLQTQVDAIQAEAEEFKKNMYILASKKETVQAQLESAETQLQAAKEKASVQVEKIMKLQSRLDLVVSDKASLANELEVARS